MDPIHPIVPTDTRRTAPVSAIKRVQRPGKRPESDAGDARRRPAGADPSAPAAGDSGAPGLDVRA